MKKFFFLASLFFVILSTSCTKLPAKSAKTEAYVPEMSDKTCFTDNAKDSDAVQRLQPVYISSKFTAAEKAAIVKALGEWNYVLNGYTQFYVVNDSVEVTDELTDKISKSEVGLLFQVAPYDDPNLEGSGVLGWCNDLRGNFIFMVSERADSFGFYTIALHEIGHSLGMPHIAVKGSLLFPYVEYQTNHVDEVAARELVSVNNYMNTNNVNWHMDHCE